MCGPVEGLAGLRGGPMSGHTATADSSGDLLLGGLIPDALERVMGLLTTPDLKTARLVNSAFHAAASSHIRIVTLQKPCHMPYQVSRLGSAVFPRLREIGVHLEGAHHIAEWVHPGVSPRVTRLTLSPPSAVTCLTDFSTHLPSGPVPNLGAFRNLRWLTVGGAHVQQCRGYDALLPSLATLERVQILCERPEDLRALQRMPNLAELDLVFTQRFDSPPAHCADEAVLFPQLRSLRIAGALPGRPDDFLPWVGQLTQLTCFTWAYNPGEVTEADLTPLAHLAGLKSLCLKPKRFGSHVPSVLPLAGLTGLTKLHFALRGFPEPGPGTLAALSALSTLRELKVWADRHPVSALDALRVESLHRLELGPFWNTPNAEGLAVLRRATNLTRLCFHAHAHEVDEGLGPTLRGLTRLRALDVQYNRVADAALHGKCACLITGSDLAPLKALRYLKVKGVFIDSPDMETLAASLGNPPWFTDSDDVGVHVANAAHSAAGVAEETARGSGDPKAARGSRNVASPHGSHMLGGFCPRDAQGGRGGRGVDSWAISMALDDREAGYFA